MAVSEIMKNCKERDEDIGNNNVEEDAGKIKFLSYDDPLKEIGKLLKID